MKKQIIQILQYTPHQYDMLTFDLFFMWCNENATNNQHLQMLLTSQAVYTWFMKEFKKNELQFLEYSLGYRKKVDVVTLRSMYDNYVTNIKYYPKALLNEIKRRAKKGFRITNNQFKIHSN